MTANRILSPSHGVLLAAGLTRLALLTGAMVIGVALIGVAAGRAAAEAPADFTFRRLKPPAPGERPRMIQIDPEEQARLLALPAPRPPRASADAAGGGGDAVPGPAAPAPPGPLDWYWQAVPAGLGPVSGRFATALATLTQGPGGAHVPAPRMQAMQEMANRFGTEILKATIGTRVSPALVLAVMGVESGGRADAVSSAGAVGLMQLIPATAARFGVADSTDPAQNIKGGVAYLDWLMKHFDGDPLLVLAAYNAGEGAVRNNGGVPPYAETRAYVPKVLAAWQVAAGLCATPPELVSDPCVFKVLAAGG